jgi:uncharacterized protein with ParB-like and HNH nuclease domain
MFRNGQINFSPGFQRKSVWTITDRRRLIQSVVGSYSLPSVFLYKREHKGRLIYDVIDGKQRLETIFMFTRQGRFSRDSFDVQLDLGDPPFSQNYIKKDIEYAGRFAVWMPEKDPRALREATAA